MPVFLDMNPFGGDCPPDCSTLDWLHCYWDFVASQCMRRDGFEIGDLVMIEGNDVFVGKITKARINLSWHTYYGGDEKFDRYRDFRLKLEPVHSSPLDAIWHKARRCKKVESTLKLLALQADEASG